MARWSKPSKEIQRQKGGGDFGGGGVSELMEQLWKLIQTKIKAPNVSDGMVSTVTYTALFGIIL
jgi:hypothetical protein